MRLCDVVPCGKKHKAKGLCNFHYNRTLKGRGVYVSPWLPHNQDNAKRGCAIEDCDEKHFGLGYCHMHYTRHRRGGDLSKARRNKVVKHKRKASKWCGGVQRDGHWSPKSEFGRNKYMDDGLRSKCKECERWEYMWARYKVSRKKYAQMLKDQMYACSICRSSDPKNQQGQWHVDHDHSCCPASSNRGCGRCVRGLLCAPCNHGLGRFDDDPDRLLAAADYLLFHSKIPSTRKAVAV